MQRTDGRHRFETDLRIGGAVADDSEQRLDSGRVADAPEGPNGLDQHAAIAARHQRQQHGHGRAILERRQPFHGECARVRIGILGERQQRGQRSLVLEPLQGERHGPPPHLRLAVDFEHGRGQLRVRLQPDEREQRQAARRRRRISPCIVAGVRRLRQRAGLDDLRDERSDRVGDRCVTDQAERFSRAALHERRRIAERRDQRIARARVAEQAERERRHLTHLGIGIVQDAKERRNAVGESHASDRQRRSPADARFAVRQHAGQVGRHRWRRWRCNGRLRPLTATRGSGRRREAAEPAPDRAACGDPRG